MDEYFHELTADDLVKRAVRNATAHVCGKSPRWVAVHDVFGLGSTYSMDLCKKFGLDPHEEIRGPREYVD